MIELVLIPGIRRGPGAMSTELELGSGTEVGAAPAQDGARPQQRFAAAVKHQCRVVHCPVWRNPACFWVFESPFFYDIFCEYVPRLAKWKLGITMLVFASFPNLII